MDEHQTGVVLGKISNTAVSLTGKVSNTAVSLVGRISDTDQKLHGTIQVPTVIGGDPYAGPYRVTPGPTEQVLRTTNKSMTQDVVVEAIPKNYGLITYSGFELTVS